MLEARIAEGFVKRMDADQIVGVKPDKRRWADDVVVQALFEVGDVTTPEGRQALTDHIISEADAKIMLGGFIEGQEVDGDDEDELKTFRQLQDRECDDYERIIHQLEASMMEAMQLRSGDLYPPERRKWQKTIYQPPSLGGPAPV